ncbi:MAG: type II secretion system F family protein [Phycisphaerales bacterium]
MKFRYEGCDRAGRPVSGHIDATSAPAARATLRERGVYVGAIQESDRTDRPDKRPTGAPRRDFRRLAAFTRQLYVLLRSGTPLTDALGAIARQTPDERWAAVIADVRQRTEQGASFAEALERHPTYFDEIYRSMVAAGESTGCLDELLDRLARLTNEQGRIRKMIAGAMIYPTILLSLGSIVLVLMLLFVLPRFAELFDSLDAPLPATTEMMIGVSNLLRAWWWAMLLLVGASAFGIRHALRTASGRRALDTALVRAPGVGRIVCSVATGRIVRLLGVLLASRLPLLEALGLLKTSVGNTRFRELLADAEEAVSRGEPISAVFARSSLISPTITEAIRSGEDAGGLGDLLMTVADFVEEDNETALRTLSTVLEPLILAVLGVIIGALAVSLFLPLFDVATAAGAH